MKKVKAIIERAADGTFSVYMNDDALEYAINGQGDTVEKAVADFRAVYEEMIAFLKAEGNGCTEVEFEFEYDVVSFLKYYAQLFTLVGLSRLTGINKGQLSHYINGKSRPGIRTIQKIQDGMAKFAGELSAVRFL